MIIKLLSEKISDNKWTFEFRFDCKTFTFETKKCIISEIVDSVHLEILTYLANEKDMSAVQIEAILDSLVIKDYMLMSRYNKKGDLYTNNL